MDSSFTQVQQKLAALLPVALQARCETAVYKKGARLFTAGDKPVDMFFIGHGEVVLERPGIHGNALVLQRTRHGFVGEASLQSARYHCDGKVVIASEITRLSIRDIQAAMASDPAFSTRWISMLNQEVRRLRLQCERLSLNRVQDRLMHLIETEGHQGSYPIGSGVKSLATELAVSHEALYRCVLSMESQALLRREGGQLKLSISSDLHQTIVKRRPCAQVGQLLTRHLVHVAAVKPEFAPPDAQAVDDTGSGAH